MIGGNFKKVEISGFSSFRSQYTVFARNIMGDDDLKLFLSMRNEIGKLDLDQLAKEGEKDRSQYGKKVCHRTWLCGKSYD